VLLAHGIELLANRRQHFVGFLQVDPQELASTASALASLSLVASGDGMGTSVDVAFSTASLRRA